MKNILLILAAIMLAFTVNAQDNNEKGPKAKNQKVWENDAESTPLYTLEDSEKAMGPMAKNQKQWVKNKNAEKKVLILNSDKQQLKGPAGKNAKPWNRTKRKNKTAPNVIALDSGMVAN